MRGQVNPRIGSQMVLKGSEHGYPPDVMRHIPIFIAAFPLSLQQVIHPDNLDCCHPYWQTHRRDVYALLSLPPPNARGAGLSS
jgi:hypothetical protein